MALETFDLMELEQSIEAELEKQPQKQMQEKPQPKPAVKPDHKAEVQHNNPENKHRVEAKKAEKKPLFERLKELPHKANHILNRARMWKTKSKHFFFYKKYLDRVKSGLYNRYGSSSPIYENRMKGDPVEILRGPAQKYIQEIVHKTNLLYKDVLALSKELENKTTAEECIETIKKYCSVYASDISNRGSKIDRTKMGWDKKLLDATKFRFARIILRNGERQVYGYTMRSCVQKGYPKPNHLIVTLFVENPEEKPEKQYVTDIFQNVESFEIIADANKQDVFSVSNMTEAVLKKTIGNNVMNEIKLYRDNAMNAFSKKELPDKKAEAKIIDEIWNGIKYSIRELLSRKEYLIDCINNYFDMVLRIDNCAYKAINSMLEIENSKLDKKYKKDLNVGRKHDDNKYDENGELISTKTDRNIQKAEQNANSTKKARMWGNDPGTKKMFRDVNKQSGW